MRMRCPVRSSVMAAVSVAGAGTAMAQGALLPLLFSEGVPGYDAAPGVTVKSRLHPELTAPGLRFRALKIFPSLDVASGYDSNVLGNAGGGARRGSWSVTTSPAVNATTDWSRNQLGVSAGLQSTQYLS